MKPEEFVALVRETFAFLEREYGFSFSWTDGYCVHFNSPNVFVSVMYDATRSYELSVDIGQVGTAGHPFELWTILRAAGRGELLEAKTAISSQASDLPQHLERLASLFKQYASNLFTGDTHLFKALGQQRDADDAAYALETILSRARQKAEKNWKQKEYGEVVKQLELLEIHLSPSEKKMLDIARKRSQSN